MGENRDDSWIKHYDFILLDLILIELAFYLSYFIKFKTLVLTNDYTRMFLVIIGIALIDGFTMDSYARIVSRGYLVELKQVLKHCAFVTIGIILGMFAMKTTEEFSRLIVVLMYPISVCFVYAGRIIWKRLVRKRIYEKQEKRKVLVISAREDLEEAINTLRIPYIPFKIVASAVYNSENCVGEKVQGVPVIGNDRESVLSYVENNVIDEVFINLSLEDNEARLMTDTFTNMGIVVNQKIIPYSFKDEHKKIQKYGGYMVMSSGMNFTTSRQLFFKRALDICGALVGLVLMGIAYIIFAPIIKHQSPGPAMFSQTRVGRNGRTFKIYKFRTMYMDAEERKKELMEKNKMDGFMFKMDDDPRIIPIGHFLRKSSIDELPQFWNILKGDMSLVGTRPPTVDEVAQYEIHHRKRLAMKPGLTGMWQVSGRSDITDFEEVVALDAKYICEWKLGLDIKILWKTVVQVLGGKGAV